MEFDLLRVQALEQAIAYHRDSPAAPGTVAETARVFLQFLSGDYP